MDPNTAQQIEQQLRDNWQQTRPQILDTFEQVSAADINAARSADDLVDRITAKTGLHPQYVEREVGQLVGVAAGAESYPSGSSEGRSARRFGSSSR